MSHPKLLISAPFFTPDELARVEAVAPSVLAGTPEERAALPEGLRAGITAMANKGHKPIDGAQMDLFPNLEVIAQFGVGYDAIDVAAATERGIRVTNTPDVLNEDVADLALAMMLGWCREIIKGDAWVRDGTWDTGESMPLNRKMSGAPVGIAGMGRIGRAIADRCAGFGMEVHYTSRSKEAIKALGPRGVVINIARGTCIDEEALIEALETGEIAGAGLDVFYNEPHVDPRLIALPNVLLQPHQASATVETRRDMSLLQCANLSAYFAGEALLTPVN